MARRAGAARRAQHSLGSRARRAAARGRRRGSGPGAGAAAGGGTAAADVLHLNNLCVDVVRVVEELPVGKAQAERAELFDALCKSDVAADTSRWEVGGAANFAIAAARLGLACECVGHTGGDAYGEFFVDVLRAEGVAVRQLLPRDGTPLPPTLVCWVLVDADGGHDFCSRFDFTPEPLLVGHTRLPAHARDAISGASRLFVNGFVFDELEPAAVLDALAVAQGAGTEVIFDAGPRCEAVMVGSIAGARDALGALLRQSAVLLLTEEEAVAVTGAEDANRAADALLAASAAQDPWVVVKLGEDGCMARTRSGSLALPGYAVDVADTVGCGDSFGAAVALGRARGLGLAETLTLANAVGAVTATATGAGRNVARVAPVEALLAGSDAAHARAALEALGGEQPLPRPR